MVWMEWSVAALSFTASALAALGLWRLAEPTLTRRRLRHVEALGPQGRAGASSGLGASAAAGAAAAAAGSAAGTPGWTTLARWTRPLARLAAPGEDQVLGVTRRRLLNAGIRHRHALQAFFGLKALAGLGLPLAGLALLTLGSWGGLPRAWPAALLALAALGYYGPNVWLAQQARRRQRRLFEAFPDALDLMTVCVEAGLGTEAAWVRVADDMAAHCPPLAEELHLLNLELRAGADRERALRNLALRTGVEEIESFVLMLLQAERFGTRIAASLRVHADELRTHRRQRAEEAAAQIGLKLLFPLIFCIFPALMVVLMGPAVLQIHRVLLPSMGSGG